MLVVPLATVEQRDVATTFMVHDQYLSSSPEQAVPAMLIQSPRQPENQRKCRKNTYVGEC